MSTVAHERYQVIALSIQPDGEQWLVGDAGQGEFYQFPPEAVHILRLLQQGHSVAQIKSSCEQRYAGRIDVEEFIGQLLQIGFIHSHAQPLTTQAQAATESADRRLQISIGQRAAQRFFSAPALLLYLALSGGAIVAMVIEPSLRPDLSALFFADRLSLTLVLLLLMYSCTGLLHEFGHMVAAARRGIASKLGLGNRLWMIVAEADLTGIYSLPKSHRYTPLLAGMAVDVLAICAITLLIALLGQLGVNSYVTHLLQALILQLMITISWQFNFFLKTDVYYLLCTYFGYPDLDLEARHYIRSLMHRLSGGLVAHPGPCEYYRLSVLRYFTLIWIAGRLLAIAFLAAVVIPTAARYVREFYLAASGQTALSYSTWDLGVFALISSALLGAGMYMWLFRRLFRRRPAA